jgi:hypothetical protein
MIIIVFLSLTRHIKSHVYTVQKMQADLNNNPLSFPKAEINNLVDECRTSVNILAAANMQ